ncbi:MAG: hypothetical protein H6Q33_4764, partial [Deltaproteobacteria bacterium]|nr:hypothetical protein [Deltaproteobacteria bacterium]
MKRAQYLGTSGIVSRWAVAAFASLACVSAFPAFAALSLSGQVQGGGAPVVGATVTLWVASAGAPKKLAQSRTGADGGFVLTTADAAKEDTSLYLVATGGRSL